MKDAIEARTSRYALGLGRSRKLIAVDSLEAASAAYCRTRDESGQGMSTLSEGVVYDLAPAMPKPVAVVSYNGRVWEIAAYRDEQRRVYESFGKGGAR